MEAGDSLVINFRTIWSSLYAVLKGKQRIWPYTRQTETTEVVARYHAHLITS